MKSIVAPQASPLIFTPRVAGRHVALGACYALLWSASPGVAQPTMTNLVVNANAEAGPGSLDGFNPLPAPGWGASGKFGALQYDAPGGWPSSTSPGSGARGQNFFSGGDSPVAVGTQTFDLSGRALNIDAECMQAELLAFLGGWQTQDDNAVVTLEFQDVFGVPLETMQIGPVLAASRNNVTSMLGWNALATVPAGTRSAKLVVTLTRVQGVANDGYAEDVAFILYNFCCDPIDFNNDGIDNDPTDIEAFLSVYSGGPCLP